MYKHKNKDNVNRHPLKEIVTLAKKKEIDK